MFWGYWNDSTCFLKKYFFSKKQYGFFTRLADPPPPGLAKDHKKYGFFFRNPSLSAIYWHYQDTHHPYVKSNTVHIEAKVKVNVKAILTFGTFWYVDKIRLVKIQWSHGKIAPSDWNLPAKFCKLVFMKWLKTSKATFITSNNKHFCAKFCEHFH